MAKETPHATHVGKLTIGEISIPCAVLSNGSRILSEHGIASAFKSRSGASKRLKKAEADAGATMPVFLASKGLLPFISEEFKSGPLVPIEYIDKNGKLQSGYDAAVLPKVCDIWLEARNAGILHAQQALKAMQAEILVRALANVGIVALVDEATGYQHDREQDALAKLLAVYLSEERLRWARFFPEEFYRQIYRIMGWRWPTGTSKRPAYIGKITNEIVYERLPPGVLEELKRRDPVNPATRRRNWKHTQFLSEDLGQPDLKNHLLQVIALMRAATNYKGLIRLLDLALPKPGTHTQAMLDIQYRD